ncbi:hypothetical protein HMPREF9318_00939 [Streptococcus urinalis FB127-CNA-2]|uniref:30S ribosomal protein S10 n=1 Tax=Streptococcus urinalis 2285-97 TaxID=764291 RepID=G5KGS3_9STRE|nr:hypothetical protein [Streptococcus urinalis]EHJ56870.1 hypothetical protein STRUR_0095 [Streptococcus urinalis 2285-97]EKS20985.1 hypothetical protein HMPREF9318_00939 [Streptococcus urinalis FB127-CNA-2]VEF30994.1 Uncharacterised protein [Streptococcus urinalis]
MGKYQLDYKGMQQVDRFHEKHSKGSSTTPKERAKLLKEQFLQKSKAKSKK